MKKTNLTNQQTKQAGRKHPKSSFLPHWRIGSLCAIILGVLAATNAQAQFSLGGAANYDVLQSGNGGTVKMVNSTNNGNIGIGSQGGLNPSLVATNSLENGNVDFASTANVTGTGSTITGTTSSNIAAVNADYAYLTNLSATLGAITGSSLTINNTGTTQTILASSGLLSGGNRVFNVSTNFNFNGNSVLTLDGQSLGQPIVLNFIGFGTSAGWGLGSGRIVLTGGLTSDQVLWNTIGSGVPMGLNSFLPGNSYSGVFLNPNGQIDVDTTTLYGRLYGGNDSIKITDSTLNAVPEPSTYALLGVGLFGALLIIHRHRRNVACADGVIEEQEDAEDAEDAEQIDALEDAKSISMVPSPRAPMKRRKLRSKQCWM